MQERVIYIDYLKGFAIICVVVGHILQKLHLFNIYPKASHIIGILCDEIYLFHMPLFFLLSGFVFSLAYLDEKKIYKDKLKQQCLNIFLVYLAFCLIEGGVKCLFSEDVDSKVGLTDIALCLLRPIGGRIWYLYVLIEIYLVFVFFFSNNTIANYILNYKKMIILLGFIACISSIFGWRNTWFEILRLTRYTIMFYMGIFIERNPIKKNLKVVIMFFLSIICIVAVVLCCMKKLRFDTPVFSILTGVSFSLFFYFLFTCINTSEAILLKGLKKCGEYSFEIYLLHEYPLSLFIKLFIRKIDEPLFGFCMTLLITMILSLSIIVMMDKVKIRYMFFRPYSYIVSHFYVNNQKRRKIK